MPFFFPVDVAVALTGAVHFTNSSFKTALLHRSADRNIIIKFGIPAIAASLSGALLLGKISHLNPVYSYTIGARSYEITPVKLVIASILLVFSVTEAFQSSAKSKPGTGGLISGGILSGFFGGLAGMQGALRGAYLIKAGLTGSGYIATGAAIAMLVDITRLPVYITQLKAVIQGENILIIFCSVISGVAGAYTGTRLFKKITIRFVQAIITVFLIIISIALGLGLI